MHSYAGQKSASGAETEELNYLPVPDSFTVAMTRPKRHLCVVGDSETVGR